MKRIKYIVQNSILMISSICLFLIITILESTEDNSEIWYKNYLVYLLLIGIILQIIEILVTRNKEFNEQTQLQEKESIDRKDKEDAKKHRERNEKFRKEYLEKKRNAEILLNKLMQESLIKESEILSVTKTLKYYQVLIYSYSYNAIFTEEQSKSLTKGKKGKIDGLRRKYPEFLAELGFVRVGPRSSTTFIINKIYLEKRLRKISELKKYLIIELDKVRSLEWKEFLDCLESFKDKSLFNHYQKAFNKNILPINFLLTESIMSSGHIGFINDKNIGLGKNTKSFLMQLLGGTKIKDIKLIKTQKIKIKEFFKKTDIEFLLDDIEIKIRNKIIKKEEEIKNEFDIEFILDIEKVSKKDLGKFFKKLKIDAREDDNVANIIIDRARQFKEALGDLNIQLT